MAALRSDTFDSVRALMELDRDTRSQVVQLQSFIKSKKPSVWVLTGRWGRGKTHLWRQLMRQAESYGRDKYCYISLFGISSVPDLKRGMFERSVPTKDAHQVGVGQYFNVESLKSFWRDNPIRKSAGMLSRLSNPWTGSFSEQWADVAYGILKSSLVCIDDLERRGSGLSMQELLGVISQLAEEKDCNVLLIANIEQLNEADRAVWDEQKEKVVDRTITFNPSAAALLRSAIGCPEDRYEQSVYEVLEKLGCSNLRISARAVSNAAELRGSIPDGAHPSTMQHIARSAALLTYCHDGGGEGAPTIHDALSHHQWTGLADVLNSEDGAPEDRAREMLLDDLGFYPEPVDQDVANLVQHGYLPETFSIRFSELDAKFKAGDVEKRSREVWEKFHSSFGGDVEAFSDEFFAAALAASRFDSALNTDSAILLLREIGASSRADRLADAWIECRIPVGAAAFDMRDIETFRPIRDDYFKAGLLRARSSVLGPLTLKAAFQQLEAKSERMAEAFAVVADASIEEVADWLTTTNGSEMRLALKVALDGYPLPRSQDAKDKIEAAIRFLASDSALDRARAMRWGVSLDE